MRVSPRPLTPRAGRRFRLVTLVATVALIALPSAGTVHATASDLGRRPATAGVLGRIAGRPTLSLGRAHALVSTAQPRTITALAAGSTTRSAPEGQYGSPWGATNTAPTAGSTTSSAPEGQYGNPRGATNTAAIIGSGIKPAVPVLCAFAFTEGTACTVLLATFTESDADADDTDPTAYVPTVHWGDGTTDTGGPNLTVVETSPDHFAINGTHIYADEGSDSIAVTATDISDGGTPVSVTDSATVGEGDSGLLISASITAVEGTAVPAGTTVGSFTDTGNPSQVASDFTASINWGDGTTTAGTVVGPTGGPFDIQASAGGHTYADEGKFTITATFFDDSPSTLSVSIISSATVAEGDAFGPAVISFSPTVFTPFSGQVATCTDTGSYTTNPASDFTASINWGDGVTDTGVAITGPVGGAYTISGNHTYTAAGPQSVTVTMKDDGTGAAVCTATTIITVAKANSSTSLTCNGSSTTLTVVYGQTVACVIDVTFAAPATSGTPTGNVSLTANGSIALGNCTLSSGTCTVTFPPPFLNASATAYTLQAGYGGDSNFIGSNSNTVSLTVNKASTSTSVTCSPNPANIGQSVTCTATVSVVAPGSGTPTGTVTFTDNGAPICTNVPLVTPAETASCTTSFTAFQVGSHTIVATYSGDGNFFGSSGTFTETVQGCSVFSALRVGTRALGIAVRDDNPATPYPIHFITFQGGAGVGTFTIRNPVIVLCVTPSQKNASATIQGTVSSTSTPSVVAPGDTVSVTVNLVGGVPGPASVTDLDTSATYTMNPPYNFGSYLHITTP